jgi:hypothetical protein
VCKRSKFQRIPAKPNRSQMANCIYCGAKTYLYQSETPLCVKCAEAMGAKPPPPKRAPLHKDHVRRILLLEVAETTARAEAASAEFKVIISSIPTGIPHPDGTQRIHQASHNLSNARKDMMRAHSRLDNFLSSGVIPEDQSTGDGE